MSNDNAANRRERLADLRREREQATQTEDNLGSNNAKLPVQNKSAGSLRGESLDPRKRQRFAQRRRSDRVVAAPLRDGNVPERKNLDNFPKLKKIMQRRASSSAYHDLVDATSKQRSGSEKTDMSKLESRLSRVEEQLDKFLSIVQNKLEETQTSFKSSNEVEVDSKKTKVDLEKEKLSRIARCLDLRD